MVGLNCISLFSIIPTLPWNNHGFDSRLKMAMKNCLYLPSSGQVNGPAGGIFIWAIERGKSISPAPMERWLQMTDTLTCSQVCGDEKNIW